MCKKELKVLFIANAETTPLGVASVSSMLKKSGHKTFGINLEYEPFTKDYILGKVDEIKPDIIALSVMYTYSEKKYIQIAEWIKDEYPNIFLVTGGIAPTITPLIFIENPNIDAICIGEGDYAMLELTTKLMNNEDITQIKNIWVKKDGKIITNEIRPLIENLDELPFPDRELFKENNPEFIPLMSGRGCPFRCTYCINHVLQKKYKDKGKYVRKRSPENFIQEVKELKEKYHPNTFFFYDDTFILNPQWINDFCNLYRQNNIRIPFSTCTNPTTLRDDVLKDLKDAGLYLLRIGLESGDEDIRMRVLNRKISDESLLNFFLLAKKYGLKIKTYNIVGLPDDTKETIFKTIIFNIKISPDIPHFCYFQPFPATELYDYCREKNLIRKEVGGFHTEPVIETGFLTLKQVKKLYQLANFITNFNKKHPKFLKDKPEWYIKMILNSFYYGILEFQVFPMLYRKIMKVKQRV